MPTRSREEYFNLPLKVDESSGTIGKMFVLVIYDISDNRRRASLAKILAGFGYRVQESAFEAMLTKGQLAKLVARIDRFAIDCDNIRIYKIRGVAAVTFYGRGRLVSAEEFVFFDIISRHCYHTLDELSIESSDPKPREGTET